MGRPSSCLSCQRPSISPSSAKCGTVVYGAFGRFGDVVIETRWKPPGDFDQSLNRASNRPTLPRTTIHLTSYPLAPRVHACDRVSHGYILKLTGCETHSSKLDAPSPQSARVSGRALLGLPGSAWRFTSPAAVRQLYVHFLLAAASHGLRREERGDGRGGDAHIAPNSSPSLVSSMMPTQASPDGFTLAGSQAIHALSNASLRSPQLHTRPCPGNEPR